MLVHAGLLAKRSYASWRLPLAAQEGEDSTRIEPERGVAQL
jgi:hypothetical protein